LLTFPRSSRQHPVAGSEVTRWVRLRPPLPGIRLRAVGGTIGARIVASLLSFGAGVITARGLGPHGRATLAVVVAIPAVFSVVGVFGFDNANARFAGRSHSAFRQAVRRSLVFSAVGGSAMAAGWALAGLRWPALRLGLNSQLTLLSAALCPISLLLTLLGTAEIGRGRISVYNRVTVATAAVYLAGVVTLLLAGHLTVGGCFLACAAGQTLGAAALLVAATTRVHADGERVDLRRYGGYAFRAYLPNLAQYGMLRMDVPIIQALAGAAAVALYAVALPVAEGVMLLPTAVALVIFPRVTSGAVGRQAADRIGHAVLAATALLAGAVALAAPVAIPAVYGVPYRGSVAVVWCMLPGLVFFSAGRTPQAYLAATDQLNRIIIATVAGCAAGLAGLVALTPRFGAAGAGLADSLCYLAFTCVVLPGALSPRRSGQASALIKRPLRWLRELGPRARRALSGQYRFTGPLLLCCAALAAGLAISLISTHGAALQMTLLSVAIVLVIVVVPGSGPVVLAIVWPVSQTSFGSQLITQKDLILLIAAVLISQAAYGRLARPKGWPVVLSVALVCYVLVSAMVVGRSIYASQNWRYALMLGIPLLGIPLIARPDAVTRRALAVFGFTSAFLAVAEIVQSHASLAATGDISAASSAVLAAGQTGAVNHNAEGAVFVLALGVMLAWLTQARGPAAKIASAAAIAALAVGIAYSFSRSSYLGALAVITLFAVRRSVRGLVCAAVTIGCLLPVLPEAVTARLATVWTSSGLDTSSALRLDLWSSALRMFDAHPLFGVGYLNFAPQLPAYYVNTGSYDAYLIQFPLLDFAHNTYLTVLAETGLAGALLVGALIVMGWRRAWSAARSGNWTGEAAMLAFVGVGVCGSFGEVLLVPPILAAFLLVVHAAGREKEVPRAG
jgi:O-antigen/teichoic acid export membrane protein/O-antigen ligase